MEVDGCDGKPVGVCCQKSNANAEMLLQFSGRIDYRSAQSITTSGGTLKLLAKMMRCAISSSLADALNPGFDG
jgi:hypothetical protein